MRPFVLYASAAVALVGVGSSTLSHRAATSTKHWATIKGLDDAFTHTANLRSGVGRCGVGIARRSGLPAAFHADLGSQVGLPDSSSFGKDETLGLWALTGSAGVRFFADEYKRIPAGHLVASSAGSSSKIDAAYLVGDYAGTEFKADTDLAKDGSGRVKASGKLPEKLAYTLVGSWDAANVGTWSQKWEGPCGASESDVYRTAADGTATLQISNARGLALDLKFAPDRSGRGTVVDGRSDVQGNLTWDSQGDGKIEWTDGATQTFENWKV